MLPIYLTSSISDCGEYLVKREGLVGKRCLSITTAAEVEEGDLAWVDEDREGMKRGGLIVDDYTLTKKNRDEVAKAIQSHDVVHVNGGNTFYLLQQMYKCGFVELIHEFVPEKKIYIGSSAGSIVAGKDIDPSSVIEEVEKAPELSSTKGLDLVEVRVFPHWGGEMFRERYLNLNYKHFYKKGLKLVFLDDNEYLKVMGKTIRFIDISD